MERFEGICKGNIYLAEISDCMYGGCKLMIWKVRQGREPKMHYTNQCDSRFDAKLSMEKCLPDADWRVLERS